MAFAREVDLLTLENEFVNAEALAAVEAAKAAVGPVPLRLRLDATEFIHDFSARHILADIAAAVHEQAQALGRRILVTAET